MSYTMSGAAKLGGALWQVAHLQPNAFLPGAFGALIAKRLLDTHSASLLGGWVIRHPFLTWPLLPVTIFVEFFAFWVAFRPAVARACIHTMNSPVDGPEPHRQDGPLR